MSDDDIYICNGKIAGITAPTEVSLNVGSDDGVRLNDAVYAYRSVDVVDPDTKALLGTVQYQRLSLKINWLAKKYSVAIVEDRYASPIGGRRRKSLTYHEEDIDGGTELVSIGEEVSIFRDTPPDPDF